jgi:hypothetical protein
MYDYASLSRETTILFVKGSSNGYSIGMAGNPFSLMVPNGTMTLVDG